MLIESDLARNCISSSARNLKHRPASIAAAFSAKPRSARPEATAAATAEWVFAARTRLGLARPRSNRAPSNAAFIIESLCQPTMRLLGSDIAPASL